MDIFAKNNTELFTTDNAFINEKTLKKIFASPLGLKFEDQNAAQLIYVAVIVVITVPKALIFHWRSWNLDFLEQLKSTILYLS
jgi:hypothetical protein